MAFHPPLLRPGPPAARIDLRGVVRPGDLVLWGQGGAEPRSLVARLEEQAAELPGLRCFAGYRLGRDQSSGSSQSSGEPWRTVSYTGTGHAAAERAGHLEVWPCHYSALPDLLRRPGRGPDVVLLQATRPGPDGRHRIALAVDYVTAALSAARAVIVEVNDQAPLLTDAPALDPAAVTEWVHASYPPLELAAAPLGPVEDAIAGHVASLIDDGATLQMGLGRTPQAALRRLCDRTDLGVHSGTLGDAMLELIECGAVTNSRKGRDRGVSVTGWVMGSTDTYRRIDGRRDVRLAPIEYTHDPEVLASLPQLVTVNSAVEVDLSGQVNCEVAAGRYVGGVGGALDFVRGAHRSRAGIPIVALPSTAGRGSAISRIVPALTGPVTIGRADAPVVVTEHGMADLRGLSLAARRDALLAVAHPDHRAALAAAEPVPGGRAAPATPSDTAPPGREEP